MSTATIPGNVTGGFPITGDEGIRRVKLNLAAATHHVEMYWVAIGGVLVVSLAWRLLVAVESRVWAQMIKSDEGYDLSQHNYRQQHNAVQPIAVQTRILRTSSWQRLVRASVAFVRKYFSEVPMPALGLSLSETVVVCMYVGYMVFLLIDNTPDIPPSSKIPLRLIGIANRAGLLAIGSLPFNVLLSNRVSIVAWILGCSYDRLQYLHRWVGRTTLCLGVVHATCKLIQNHSFADHSFRRFGLGAFVVVSFLLVWTNRLMRRKCYETFIAGHIAGVIAMVVLVWNHIPRERKYLIATVAVWVADRAFRWIRIFAYNGLWRIGKSRRSINYATLRLLSHDTTRLEVYKADFTWWKAGAYAYVSTPGLTWWPQSHPFTIASRPGRSSPYMKISSPMSPQGGSNVAVNFNSQKDVSHMSASSSTLEPNLIFLIRSRGGWTKKLHDLAKKTATPSVPVIIDGPYDGTPELHKHFDTVVLFAGGAGISWTLPILMDLVQRSRRHQSAVRRIIWVCVMRHYVNYDWFFNELEMIVKQSGDAWLDVRIHYTTNAEDVNLVPTFFRPGRPDIGGIIEEAVNSAQGRTFIGVAGPHGPSEEVRRNARLMTSPMAILRGNPRGDVMFYTEEFGW